MTDLAGRSRMSRIAKIGVLAVLGLLAVAAIVATRETRKSAVLGRQINCLSNVYNLASGAAMYQMDHDGYLPEARGWVVALASYRRDDGVLKCPEDHSAARCSYGMNAAFSGMRVGSGVRGSLPGREGVLFYETAHPGDSPVGGAADVVLHPRHPLGNNYGYLPQHAAPSRGVPSFAVE